MQKTEKTECQDVYTRITAQIVADLEKGVRPGETMERRTIRRRRTSVRVQTVAIVRTTGHFTPAFETLSPKTIRRG